jgi:membrane protein YqaA with SNARE-associated domain
MESSIIAAVSAILGSTVGGVTTFATTFVNQRYVARREMLVKDVANREELYAEFLK